MSKNTSPKIQQNYLSWITAIAIVKFDIDQGQKVDIIIPDLSISHQQQKQIAMLAFPDSNSLGEYQGTFKYIYKLKNNCFGYTCFKQKKDPENARGYSQRSLVILSQLPFPQFFLRMCQFLVFKTFHNFQKLSSSLQTLYQQTLTWPQPIPLREYGLPVLEYQLNIEIPNYIVGQQGIDKNNVGMEPIVKDMISLEEIVTKEALKRAGRFQEIKLTNTFSYGSQVLWMLWEAAILNKKLLIMGTNPYQVSQAVLGVISLINPICYQGQFSPYVTVFDTNLKRYQTNSQHFIIGGTNPLFNKLFNSKDILTVDITGKKYEKTFKQRASPVAIKQITYDSKNEQQKAINQSTLRKYFYRLNKSIISQIQQYVNSQKNDLKFFNKKQFINFIKYKQNLEHLEHLYQKKKYLIAFFQKFIQTHNFKAFLKSRNIHTTNS